MAQTKNTKSSGTKAKTTSKSKSASAKSAETKKQTSKKSAEARTDTPREEGFVYQLTPYIVALCALLLAVCIIAGEGKIGGGIRDVLAGLFAGAAYVLPILILIRAITWRRDMEDGAFVGRTSCMGIIFILLAMLLHILGGGEATLSAAAHFDDGKIFVGGGVIGGLLGELLLRGFGKICSLILLFAAIALLVLYVAGMTPRGVFIYIAYKIKVAIDNRRQRMDERMMERQNPARRERQKVREEEYLEYLREKRRRQRETPAYPVELPAAENQLTPITPIVPQNPSPQGTIYRVKKRSAADIEIPTDDEQQNAHPVEDTAARNQYEETVVAGGTVLMESDDAVDEAKVKEALTDTKVDTGAVDEKIFDEVMRRTRERIEKSRKTEGIRETAEPQPLPKTIHRQSVVVDTETGEVLEENPQNEDAEDFTDADGSETEITGGDVLDAVEVAAMEIHSKSKENADTTDTVRLAASVSGVSDDGEYDVSNIFVNPEDAELLDKLSEAYKQNVSTSLEVKRGAISTAENHESAKVKAAAPDYKFPPVELLTEDTSNNDEDIKDELQDNAVKLVETLKSFNVKTKIEDISRGPTITRYELFPEPGTRVRSITSLVDDIALNLATKGVRIEAPIPGKSAVGIEVPNKNQATVHLRTLICDDRFVNAKSKLTVCLGEDVAGEAVYFDIAKMPHLLIAGTTGSGKSVCINSIITSLLYKASPDDVKMILIDPKKVELNIYNGIPHLLSPVISDPKKAAGSLSWAVSEMERRFGLIEAVGVRDITAYNKVTKDDPDYEFMNRIVIIIDELADFMMTAPDEVEDSICRIAQKARAAGMHLIIGTQRPSVNVITGLIKANIPSRIAFAVSSQVDSRVILDKVGAETLIGRGDMLFSPVGAMTPVRVQGAFVSEEDVEEVVSYIKNMNPVDGTYSEEVQKQIEQEALKCGGGKKGASVSAGGAVQSDEDGENEDPMLKAAIELAVDSGKISTSLIQRKLSLGYGRAAKLIDAMENLGYVSGSEGQKPRRVLITKQQYMEMVLKDDAPFD